MNIFRPHSWLRTIFLAGAATLAVASAVDLSANPQGMTVTRGTATVQVNGSQLNVSVGQNTFLDWRSFNIQPGETTTFLQPSSSSIVLNRINDANPSQIWGNLNANGTVILANTHGFYFGPNSMIQVGGNFVATTAPIRPDLGGVGTWQFTGLPPLASIVNYGLIEAGAGRSLFLIAEKIENHGELKAPAGNVGLHAGAEVLLSERPDGRGLSATVKLPSGSVDNTGRIVADAGSIALQAQVVNQDGVLQANSVRDRNGVIELVASDELNLGAGSRILARGDDSPGSRGGDITLKSGQTFRDSAGSEIVVTGGAHGGDGGNVEVSAPTIVSLDSRMDAGAQNGSRAGRLLLDPTDIVLDRSGAGDPGSGTVGAGDSSGTLELNVDTAFANKNFSEIVLQATRDISLAQGTVWSLSDSTGVNDGHLTLQAGRNITFENNASIVDANNWAVRLEAGVDFVSGNVQAGIGSIFLNGGAGQNFNGAIETTRGAIDMKAGDSIVVGTGYIRTMGGGDIHLSALNGDIDAGKKNDGYEFTISGYRVSLAGLGGIATGAGGDVTLEAGRDIISLPTVPVNQPPGASGAYGTEAGDVTLVAGRTILGNFLVRNGTGTLLAGVQVENSQVTETLNPDADIGSATSPVSLSLVSGVWNVWAARDVFISEVRNPSGTFNRNRQTVPPGVFPGNSADPGIISPPARVAFLFDYAPDAAANLWAGNSISLIGANLPRVTGQNQNMPAIYPPQLSLNAGAGGIDVGNSLILFPSSEGSLHITTRDGGNLSGRQQQATLTGITMSDSGLPDFASFAQGHAIVPLHLHDDEPVQLDISGNIQNFGLTVPTFARVNVGGDTYNFGFLGQNLSPAAVTEIHVAGDIRYRGNLSSVSLFEPLPSDVLNPSINASPQVAQKLRYDPATGQLSFIGQMTEGELNTLLHPLALLFDRLGFPLVDENGVQLTAPIAVTAVQQDAFRALYDATQTATLGDQGLALAGPGHFNITARNIDLGISGGIAVLAPTPALAAVSPFGATLGVNVSGNLDMTSTRIANESLSGDIQLQVGGRLDVGGQSSTFGDPAAPKGIFTSSGGSVSVVADGDVNLNGSRIAAYNGGNIVVRSDHGDVNAGSGGAGYVSLRSLELDPATGQLRAIPATIPGSGILATTVPGSSADLGNITVNAPEGNINASAGGIIQLAFNDHDPRNAVIILNAGHDIDAGGSGVIGNNLRLNAGGDINGIVIGSQNVDISTVKNANVAVFAGGGASVTAGGSVSGTIVGGSSVAVSGDAISAALISQSVSAAGDTSGSAIGVPQSNVAKSDVKISEDAAISGDKTVENGIETEEEKRRKGKNIVLTQKVGRVTVVLPGKDR